MVLLTPFTHTKKTISLYFTSKKDANGVYFTYKKDNTVV